MNLRDVTFNDLRMILNWRNQEHIRKSMYNDKEISWEQHTKWFQKVQSDNSRVIKIFEYNNHPYGFLNIYNIDKNSGTCVWGFYIGENNSEKGSGTRLAYVALNYLFDECNLRKITGEVLASNIRSRKYHKSLGFKNEGILRQHILRGNNYEDVYLYSILESEWREKKASIYNKICLL
ncbi:UDP-4-amino-4,6-dideoxy-N-acetyl-beta-L-altrosamine N-acetyltransferase [Lysinibacillus xylanilyticus]|uniref:UDP-4-amino-4, 6-dideoxy-N-acetyl-beta-L-altrosamine N-acetyltransferase n=1 Tax=Lysinibacillus xylanilyticus TaxID=582475 RepID=UPI003D0862A3